MTYNTLIERLFHAGLSQAMRFTLENMQVLDEALGLPSRSNPTIHVAGSNGKGSVAWKIARALEAAGFRVGLYTSPHLFTFRERITINGEYISEEDVTRGLEQIFALTEKLGIKPSFFELTTTLAFLYFQKLGVDYAVIETGLGGRLDATNVIQPISTVITSISREHAHILGDELEMIAAEKAGIIKENTPLVLGPRARFQSIYTKAELLKAPIYVSKKISQYYDEENSAVARLVLEHLPIKLEADAIEKGIASRPACRFERCGEVIFDVAHNPDAIFYLLQALYAFYPRRQLRFVVGFSEDKEYDVCLQLIADVASHIHLVQASNLRAASVHVLAKSLSQTPCTVHSSVKQGVEEAYAAALQEGELLIISGSFYIMADAKEALGIHAPRDTLDLNEKILSGAAASSSLI